MEGCLQGFDTMPGNKMKYIKSQRTDFQMVLNNQITDIFFLTNKNGIEMAVTNFGARVVELWVPDRYGEFADIVLGHSRLEEYINYKGERFLGAVVGRFANRIAGGRFQLDGANYQLPQNDGSNSLHGGDVGFDMIVWKVIRATDSKIIFNYMSKDGEQGFPGNLNVTMTYELTDGNEFVIEYYATTDRRTVVNLTHHSFFNLRGEGRGGINDHLLAINADHYTPVNVQMLPTGEVHAVDGTPMDFRSPKAIGHHLESDFEQLVHGKGYDHNWLLNRRLGDRLSWAATILEPGSGRCMEVLTTQPGIQFYGSNLFDGKHKGKSGRYYGYRESFALETQHLPDSPNQPQFPTTILDPGEDYRQHCVYKFSVQ
jgi:aldose 1-epimerase